MESMDEFVDSTSALSNECAVSFFQCRTDGCGKQCKSTDEGVNPFMKRCNACDIILRASLDSLNDGQNEGNTPPETEDQNEGTNESEQEHDENPPSELEAEVGDNAREADQALLSIPQFEKEAESPGGPMTMEEIATSLRLLVQACDNRLTVDIRLGLLNY